VSIADLRRIVILFAFAVLVWVPEARAHHGKEYLLVQTSELPHRGQFFFLADFSAERGEGGTALAFAPAVLLGLSDRASIEIHSHVHREAGEQWSYEATAPELRVSLTSPHSRAALRAALSAEYEIGHGEAPDRVAGTGVLAVYAGSSNLSFNLTAAREQEEGARTGWSYAVGFRPNLERRVDLGFELHGALNDAAEEEGHELMLGLYAQASERVTLKAGVGRGFGDAPDWSFRGGFVIGF